MPTAAQLMASVADSDDSAYSLSSDYRLLEVNAGYLRFAQDNRGVVSTERWRHESVLQAISGPLRGFFGAAFARALETGKPWEHHYECSSPERLRTFHMTAYPVGGCLVVIHAQRFESEHSRLVCAPDDRIYAREGLIKMCSHCRRVRNPTGHKRWDWVPSYLCGAPVAITHGLCEPCAEFYWP